MVPRDDLSGAFNFRMTANSIDDEVGFQAGFQEVSGLGREITIEGCRDGKGPEKDMRKLSGMGKPGYVTLKSGVISSTEFLNWMQATCVGEHDRPLQVTIDVLDEANEAPVMIWKLTNVRPIKCTAPSLNARSSSMAIEELVLAYEAMVMK